MRQGIDRLAGGIAIKPFKVGMHLFALTGLLQKLSLIHI
jgi:hypothetical protein